MNECNNKEIMANNIKHFMTLQNKSRNTVCNDLGFKYTTFVDWIKAKTYPRIDKIELMANYFGVSKKDLIEMPTIDTTVNADETLQDLTISENFFRFKITEDSMAPRIFTGDTVIVQKQEDADSGDIIIAILDDSATICRRLKKYETGIALLSPYHIYFPGGFHFLRGVIPFLLPISL